MTVNAKLQEDRIIIWDAKKAQKIWDEGYFGKPFEDRLELALIEAVYLLEKDEIAVKMDKNKMTFQEFFDYCMKKDPRFDFRYAVYKDLREKGYPTRSGFKFGCDFRVYNKGSNPLKKGIKEAGEHTKWIVFAVPENFSFSFPELSRAVRLAHNIRANMLWAVVSIDKTTVKYYSVSFFKP